MCSIMWLRFSNIVAPGTVGMPPTTIRAGSPSQCVSTTWNVRGPEPQKPAGLAAAVAMARLLAAEGGRQAGRSRARTGRMLGS